MKRLFIAIDIDEKIKACLSSFQNPFQGQKWTSLEQLHITLKFLGDTDEVLISQIKENLALIKRERFSVSIKETGFFPNKKRPSIFWLGISPEPKLISLKNDIDKALLPLGIQTENREFSPHLTLMRIKFFKDISLPEKLASTFSDFPKQTMDVKSFILYSSTLTKSGPIHNKETEYYNL